MKEIACIPCAPLRQVEHKCVRVPTFSQLEVKKCALSKSPKTPYNIQSTHKTPRRDQMEINSTLRHTAKLASQ